MNPKTLCIAKPRLLPQSVVELLSLVGSKLLLQFAAARIGIFFFRFFFINLLKANDDDSSGSRDSNDANDA